MLEYYCKALGEDLWSVVKAESLNDAASKYVSKSAVLDEWASEDYVKVLVKLDASDSKIYTFLVTVETTYVSKMV